MRILITGASGFIGRHLSRMLISRGDEVYALSRSVPPRGTKHIPVLDYTPATLSSALKNRIFDQVYHLVGAGSKPTDRTLLTLMRVNAVLPGVMVDAATQCRARSFIYSGSYAEYAAPNHHELLEENFPVEQNDAYGSSKAAGSEFALLQGIFCNLPVGVARLFNIYGEEDTLPHRLFPSLVSRLRNNEPVPLSDGKQICDFLYVRDACEGMICMADALMREEAVSGVYNICSGEPLSIAAFAKATAASIGADENLLQFGALPQRLVPDPECMVGSTVKMSRSFNWKMKTSLNEGLGLSIK